MLGVFSGPAQHAPFLRPLVRNSSRGETQLLTKSLKLSPKIGD